MLLRFIWVHLVRWSLAGGALALAGCATPPPADDPDAVAEFKQTNDPLEPTNRAIFQFNEGIETMFLRPAAVTYRFLVPQFGRDRVADFLANLNSPLILANDLLQGNMTLAGQTAERFVLNSTFGVLGIMDVAKPLGIPPHDADLGETLGVWGVDAGPYLVLPLFGPSDPRDGAGAIAEIFADPLDIYLDTHHMLWVDWTRFGVTAVSKEEAYMDYLDDVRRSSLDYYAAMRSLYRQRRAALIEAAKHDERSISPALAPKNTSSP